MLDLKGIKKVIADGTGVVEGLRMAANEADANLAVRDGAGRGPGGASLEVPRQSRRIRLSPR